MKWLTNRRYSLPYILVYNCVYRLFSLVGYFIHASKSYLLIRRKYAPFWGTTIKMKAGMKVLFQLKCYLGVSFKITQDNIILWFLSVVKCSKICNWDLSGWHLILTEQTKLLVAAKEIIFNLDNILPKLFLYYLKFYDRCENNIQNEKCSPNKVFIKIKTLSSNI